MRRSVSLTFVATLVALVLAVPALSWTWPAGGPVVRAFSLGDDPYAGGQHRGIDVAGEVGSDVRAPAAGTVSFAGTVPNNGRTVTIQTADGYAVTLVGLGSIAVSKNAVVSEGQKVGTIAPAPADGSPANVHFGVRISSDPNGYIDPQTLLPVREQAPPSGDQVPDSGTGTGASEIPSQAGDGTPTAPDEQPAESGGGAADAEPSPASPAEAPVETGAGAAASASGDQQAPAPEETTEPQPAAADVSPTAATDSVQSQPVQPVATAPAERSPNPVAGDKSAGKLPSSSTKPATEAPPATGASVPGRAGTSLAASVAPHVGAQTSLSSSSSQGNWTRSDPVAAKKSGSSSGSERPAAARETASTLALVRAGARLHASAGSSHWRWVFLPALLLLGLGAVSGSAVAVVRALGSKRPPRMMLSPEGGAGSDGREQESREDPGCGGLAVCQRPAPHWARRRVRRPVRHLRPLSPAQGQRRADGEWHRRARDAGHGRGREGRTIAS